MLSLPPCVIYNIRKPQTALNLISKLTVNRLNVDPE